MIPGKLTHGEKFSAIFGKWNALIDYLYRLRPVAGPGIKISRTASGTVFSASGSTHNATVLSRMFCSFKVTPTADEKLSISEGFANINGITKIVPASEIGTATLKAGEHLLCVYTDISDQDGLLPPAPMFHDYDEKHFPIAKIRKSEDGALTVQQYPVTVATFILTRKCIFARKS